MTRFTLFAAITLPFCCSTLSAYDQKAEGKEIKPLLVLHGHKSKFGDASCQRITSADEWKKLWAAHQTGSQDLKELPAVFEYADFDFEQVMIVSIIDQAINHPGYVGFS